MLRYSGPYTRNDLMIHDRCIGTVHFRGTSAFQSNYSQILAFNHVATTGDLAEFNGHQVCQGEGLSTLMRANPAGWRLLVLTAESGDVIQTLHFSYLLYTTAK